MSGLGFAACQKGESPFPCCALVLPCAAESGGMMMLVLPFSLLPTAHFSIWSSNLVLFCLCAGFVFFLCGLWQHRISGKRAGPLETGRMFDMGNLFFVLEQKRLKIFSTNTRSWVQVRKEFVVQFHRNSREEWSRVRWQLPRSVMLTHTTLGSWTPGPVAGKLPELQAPK